MKKNNEKKVVPLDALKAGSEAEIVSMASGNPMLQRLRELGLLPGTRIKLVRFAPLGDPLEILVRGSRLCLRRTEANEISVQPL